ncbi:MAG: hypothetical protein OXE96_13435 [Gemmatimonadetes bacterium]|nr:hypothetical protein [Gemmatimonadota bacterium]
MRRFSGLLALGVVVLLGVAFAMGNAGREVTINLGIATLSGVPVTFVAFGGMVIGMGVVLVAGINADLKVRRLLRERHLKESLTENTKAGTGPATLTDAGPHHGETLLE